MYILRIVHVQYVHKYGGVGFPPPNCTTVHLQVRTCIKFKASVRNVFAICLVADQYCTYMYVGYG